MRRCAVPPGDAPVPLPVERPGADPRVSLYVAELALCRGEPMNLEHARYIDLHLHSSASDGKYPPEEVIERCLESNLQVVALTDHDLCAALEPGVYRSGSRSLQLIAGAEVSGSHEGREFHLLVYFAGDIPTGFHDFCLAQARMRAERFESASRALGLEPTLLDDAAREGRRSLTRLHLARSLVHAGKCRTTQEAFSQFLKPGVVPTFEFPFVEVIRIAREHGGLTSWAHPPKSAVEDHLECFVDAGLQGLEAHRPFVSSALNRFYRKRTRRLGLFSTGGSDWHGWSQGNVGLFSVDAPRIRGFLQALEAA